jgi:hypothetical protein
MLIDFHTHQFPDGMAQRTIEGLKKGIKKCQGMDYTERSNGTLTGLVELMDRTGVDISVVLPVATKVTQAATINRLALELNRSQNRVISFGALHPLQEDWEDTLLWLAENGFKGIKLHPEFQKVHVDGPETIRILKKCEELGLYCVFHAGADIGIEPPVHGSPLQFSHVLQEVSGRYIILAHMGGWRMWDDVEQYLVGTPVYMDTAFSAQFLEPRQYRRIIKNHGAEKILFGSDSPWESPAETRNGLEALELTEAELEQIYSQNALRILGL